MRRWLPALLVILAVVTTWHASALDSAWTWFDNHLACMLIGWIAIVGNSVLVKKEGGYANTKTHQNLMALAAGVIIAGFYVIYSNKEAFGKPHFTTLHGQTGVVLVGLVVLISLAALLFLNPDSGFLRENRIVRAAHKYGGKTVILVAWYTCYQGLEKIGLPQTSLYTFAGSLGVCALCVLVL